MDLESSQIGLANTFQATYSKITDRMIKLMNSIIRILDRVSRARIWFVFSLFAGIAVLLTFSGNLTGGRFGSGSVVYAGAPKMALNLQSASSVEMRDLAGATVYFGGQVFENGAQIGNFAAQQRITPAGTDDLNTAQLTMTLFFSGQTPPDNITIEGASDFNSNFAMGSVSAASSRFKPYIGESFQFRPVDTNDFVLTIK